ncbi:hypothetical protein ACRW2B_26485, partial [Escherichia coli]
TGPQSIHILRGVRQQQDEPGRFSICSRQAAVVQVVAALMAIGDELRRLRLAVREQGTRDDS